MARSDAVWSAQGTMPEEIEAALRDLLIQVHSENDDVVPARVLNMIAFVDREWTGEIANRMRGVGRYHASRMVVLAYEPGRESLDARVMISSDAPAGPGDLALLRETVVVELGDCHLDDLLTIADPLVVTDLPTLLWSPHGHHEVIAELLALAQAVLLDSVEETDPHEALERASALSAEAYVVDLAWLRSTPWRERLAASFDRPARRTTVNDAAGLGAAICAAVGHGLYPDWDQATSAMVSAGDQFAPDARAARAYQQINTVYAALTTFTDPLFRSMADGLQGLERA